MIIFLFFLLIEEINKYKMQTKIYKYIQYVHDSLCFLLLTERNQLYLLWRVKFYYNKVTSVIFFGITNVSLYKQMELIIIIKHCN